MPESATVPRLLPVLSSVKVTKPLGVVGMPRLGGLTDTPGVGWLARRAEPEPA